MLKNHRLQIYRALKYFGAIVAAQLLMSCGGSNGEPKTLAPPHSERTQIAAAPAAALASASTQDGSIILKEYKVLQTARVGRTTFELTLQATIESRSSVDAINVSVGLQSNSPSVQVLDSSSAFGTVKAGEIKTSADTLKVRIDRANSLDSSAISWTLAGANVIGPNGGTIATPAGISLSIKPNSLSRTTPIAISDFDVAATGLQIPQGFTFRAAFSLNIGPNKLSAPGTISIPTSVEPPKPVIIAKIETSTSPAKLSLVATTAYDPTSKVLVSELNQLANIDRSGEYVILALPQGLGIIGVTVYSSNTGSTNTTIRKLALASVSATAVEGAVVSVLLQTPPLGASQALLETSTSSLSSFIAKTDINGFTAIPGVIPNSAASVVAIKDNQGVGSIGYIQIDIGDIIQNGLIGNGLQNIILSKIDTSHIPDKEPDCQCGGLIVTPHEIGTSPIFFEGSRESVTSVFCGASDVKSSSTLSDFSLGLLLNGASVNTTVYISDKPSIANIDVAGQGSPTVVGLSAGQAKIIVSMSSIQFYKFNGTVQPKACNAAGSINPVIVTGQPTLTISRIGGAAGDGLVSSLVPLVPDKINCGGTCTAKFSVGEQVAIGASVLAGKNASFAAWGGDCSACGTSALCVFDIFKSKVCTAQFDSTDTITVLSASYGNACGNANGNVTGIVAQQCDGKSTCNVFVHNNVLGDPFFGCPKDFEAIYTCGAGSKTASHPPVGNEGYTVTLSCP